MVQDLDCFIERVGRSVGEPDEGFVLDHPDLDSGQESKSAVAIKKVL